MKQNRIIILIVLVALPLLGAWAGRLAAPVLARQSYTVRLAEYVWKNEQNENPAKAGTPELNVPKPDAQHYVDEFKRSGMPSAQLYADAREVRARFGRLAAWFGLWCGLVAALKIASITMWKRQREYDADPAHCLACARCYLSCPVERERLQQELGERPL